MFIFYFVKMYVHIVVFSKNMYVMHILYMFERYNFFTGVSLDIKHLPTTALEVMFLRIIH